MSFDKHIYLYSYHLSQHIEHFHRLRKFPGALAQSIAPSLSLDDNWSAICHYKLSVHVLEFHINIQHIIFCVWLSLTQHYYVFETHPHVSVVNVILFLSNIPLFEHTTICLSILLLMNKLSCFRFLVITNKAALNICVQVPGWRYISIVLRKYLRVELPGHMVNTCTLNFMRKQQLIF